MLDLFRYAHPSKKLHQIMVLISAIAALMWLYYTVVAQQLLPRMIKGETELLDSLIGFPLILALAIVIYAIVYWSIKWLIIFIAPQKLSLPPEEDEVEFDPSTQDDQPPSDKP
ncbi:MAG: hypothetical protein IBX48_03360 [Thiomicrospira sp.]|uniref:hypothetical protein n=1 Tax=Thiomicrospira sp. TaxID=935 RepID=UPI0019E92469|nr:hypothetical protein [Thiomicrospira sp.]MBE0493357.1 hypothetical protein [Thiomicrospira sp.]